jgi:large subunit ribosomal protein L24
MVTVTKGRDKGKRGRVISVDKKRNRAVVEGINIVTRHQKPTGAFRQGGIIQKEIAVPVSNLAYYDEGSDASGKIGYSFLADGTKARIFKKSGEVIE